MSKNTISILNGTNFSAMMNNNMLTPASIDSLGNIYSFAKAEIAKYSSNGTQIFYKPIANKKPFYSLNNPTPDKRDNIYFFTVVGTRVYAYKFNGKGEFQ
jgi:hypothetical protein